MKDWQPTPILGAIPVVVGFFCADWMEWVA
jgi:hypothetical protein